MSGPGVCSHLATTSHGSRTKWTEIRKGVFSSAYLTHAAKRECVCSPFAFILWCVFDFLYYFFNARIRPRQDAQYANTHTNESPDKGLTKFEGTWVWKLNKIWLSPYLTPQQQNPNMQSLITGKTVLLSQNPTLPIQSGFWICSLKSSSLLLQITFRPKFPMSPVSQFHQHREKFDVLDLQYCTCFMFG